MTPLRVEELEVMLREHRHRRDRTLSRMVIPCGSQTLPRVSVRQDYRSWAWHWEIAIMTEISKRDASQ